MTTIKYEIQMIDLDGRIVASTIKDAVNITEETLKTIEKSQNEVLTAVGFKGYCKLRWIG